MSKNSTLRFVVLAILATSFSLTTSCKKEEGHTSSGTISESLVTKETYSDGDNTVYMYDTQNRLIKLHDGDSDSDNIQFAYDTNNRLAKIMNFANNVLKGSGVVAYNSQGKWTKITSSWPGEVDTDVTTAVYDADGNRVKISTSTETYTFHYSDGNLIKSIYTNKNSNATTTYEYYTDKQNKIGTFEEMSNLGIGGTPSKNMLKKELFTSSHSSTPTITHYSYEYNAEGFPTKITSFGDYDKNGDGKIDASDSSITSYTYQSKE